MTRPNRLRRYLMGIALGEPVALRMTLLVIAVLAVAVSIGWVIWQGQHCKPVPAHQYYMARERC